MKKIISIYLTFVLLPFLALADDSVDIYTLQSYTTYGKTVNLRKKNAFPDLLQVNGYPKLKYEIKGKTLNMFKEMNAVKDAKKKAA